MSNASLLPMLVGIEVSIVALFVAVLGVFFQTSALIAVAGLTLLLGAVGVVRGYQA